MNRGSRTLGRIISLPISLLCPPRVDIGSAADPPPDGRSPSIGKRDDGQEPSPLAIGYRLSVWVGLLQGLAGEAGGDDAGALGAGGEVVVGAGQAVGDNVLGGLGLGDLLVEVGGFGLGGGAHALDGRGA